MGSSKVFDWTRAVVSSEYLSSIPSTVDRSTFFSRIADRLSLDTDLNETNGHPAFQGKWINILKAEIILKEFLTKWKDSRQESTGQKNKTVTDDIDQTPVLIEVPDIDCGNRKITDGLLNKLSKQGCEETVTSKLKNDTNRSHRVYTLTDNLKHLYSGNKVRVVSENVEKDVTKQIVVPLLDSAHEEKNKDNEIQNEELQELYMNITVTPFKEYTKKKGNSLEGKLIWDETDKETGENPLDRLCQLLRIDEEEGKDKRCVESDRKRKYEDNLPFKYFCSHCSFKSKRKNHFIKHCRLHDKPQKLYMCGQCDFKTIRISTLRRHELVHSENKLLLCDLCPYKTDDPKFLAKHHSLKHTGNKLIKCNQCEYSTGSQREFRRHALTHKPNKPATLWNCDQV